MIVSHLWLLYFFCLDLCLSSCDHICFGPLVKPFFFFFWCIMFLNSFACIKFFYFFLIVVWMLLVFISFLVTSLVPFFHYILFTFLSWLGMFRWIWNIIIIDLSKVWLAWCKSQPGLKILSLILWRSVIMLGHTWGNSSRTLPRRRSDAHDWCLYNSSYLLLFVDCMYMVK